MSRRYIEFKAAEIHSLQDRILQLTEMMFAAHDASTNDDRKRQIMFDIYFLHGMRQMMDVLINHPDELYRYLHEETSAVESTFKYYLSREG